MNRFAFYSPQLDGLRFCAALLVFVHHGPQIRGFSIFSTYGWLGVDLFLCISAFLLTRLLRMEFAATGHIDVFKFFARRALRIWSLYFAFTTLTTALALWRAEIPYTEVWAWFASHLTFSNNLLTAAWGFSPVPHTAHLWTISLEEQAYLILPFVILLSIASKASVKTNLIAVAGAIALLVVFRFCFYIAEAPYLMIWVLPLRGDAFVIGYAAAILTESKSVRAPMGFALLGGVFFIAAAAFPTIYQHSLYHVIGFTITAAGCGLIVAATQGQFLGNRILENPVMRYLGKISYGIYVYHLLVISMVAGKIPSSAGTFIVALLLTIGLSAASYEILEKYFIKKKASVSRIISRPD